MINRRKLLRELLKEILIGYNTEKKQKACE